MKTLFLGAAGMLAVSTGASQAQTILSGYAGAGANYTNVSEHTTQTFQSGNIFNVEDVSSMEGGSTISELSSAHQHATSYYVEGAVALPVTGIVGAQADFSYQNVGATTGYSSAFNGGFNSRTHQHEDATVATAHVYARTSQFLVGGFVGEQDISFGRLIGGGVEGQYYFGPFTLGASAGAAKVSDGFLTSGQSNGLSPVVWSVRGDVRYFVTPELSVGVHGGYLEAEGVSNQNFSESGPKLWTVGASAEYMIPHSPFTVLAAYEHGHATTREEDNGGGFDTIRTKSEGDAVRVGVRWTFGGSLLQRDRHGAGLNTFQDAFGGQFRDNISAFASGLVD